MASDRIVTPQHVLKSVMEHERRGSTELLSELEKLEPDLVEYLLENLSRVFHQLTGQGLSGRDARKVYRQAEKTALVCIMALRHAHRDLWDQGAAGAAEAEEPDEPPSTPT